MATAARSSCLAALRSAPSSIKTSAALPARFKALRQPIVQQSRRWQSSGEQSNANPEQPRRAPSSKGVPYFLLGVGVATIVAGFAYTKMTEEGESKGEKASEAVPYVPKLEDYQKVYDAIAERLQEHDEYDDGSYGPVLLRLGWHASGTYDKETGTGGSNGATMRFAPEGDHGANAGLQAARDFLEPVKAQFSWITYSDLWTLAAACAIQEMQGPKIPWRPGRSDRDLSFCTPDGRLPDASKTQDHLRGIFYRMGFNDKEIVALSGAHALGRCHTDRSGFDGPWTFSPTTLTNDYYKLLLEEKWSYKKWNGPRQFEDVSTKSLMMLPSDMALIQDKSFRKTVERYAKDNEEFFRDFSDVVMRLFELGVPFTSSEDSRFRFKSSFD